jgi:Flp pilus assembly protein TadD
MRISFWTLAAWTAISLLAGFTPCKGQDVFQVSGKILQSDGRPFPRALPVLFLDSATSPLALRTHADRGGVFTFKGVPAGTYTLIAHIPLEGEYRKTVEVGPSLADSRGRITLEIRVDRLDSQELGHLVSAAELAIPAEAKREYLKAMFLLERNQVDGAVASLQRAVRIAPQFVEGWNHLGTIAYATRNYAQAERYFRTALEHDPGAYSPTVNLGGALLALGRVEESLDFNRRAVQMKPDDPLAQSQLGMSYYFLGRYDAAESSLKQAKALDPGHFTLPQLLLASILERNANLPGAIRELEDFLKHHPDSERAPSVQMQVERLRARLRDTKAPPGKS